LKVKEMIMKAIRVHEYGGPEQLRYEDAPEPKAESGTVLVRIHAASVNPIDFKLASGAMRQIMPLSFPWIPGGDFSGVVENVGPGVSGLKKGDAVYGDAPGGGAYAALFAAPAGMVAPKPRRLSDVEAASVPLAAQTAWQGLFDHGHLERGQTVLIHGASGGVGTFAVQLAHWKGATVFATASASNADYLRSLGADQVIDYKATPFESVAKNVDLVYDLIGGETQRRSYGVLKPGGRLIATAQPPSEQDAAKHKVQAMMMRMNASTANLTQLTELLDSGRIKTLVAKTYPLTHARDAWTDIMSGHTRGKIVLQMLNGS
jgi:NADPH:quinone reductase-like Zn-dependent oxidoreductase